MLRIHTEEQRNPDTVTLRLEGKLIQPWVDELQRTWMSLLRRLPAGTGVQVDLNAVSFVDEDGQYLLKALDRKGCRLLGTSPFIATLLQERMNEERGRTEARS